MAITNSIKTLFNGIAVILVILMQLQAKASLKILSIITSWSHLYYIDIILFSIFVFIVIYT